MPKPTDPETVREIRRLADTELSYTEIGRITGVARTAAWMLASHRRQADIPLLDGSAA